MIEARKRHQHSGRQAIEILSSSPDETHQIGKRLARALPFPCVVLLRGALGSGKTTLTRGIAEGLGLEDPTRVTSPSFTLVNHYSGRCPIYHVDLYRLEGGRDLYSIGLDEFMGKEGVTIVEWSERLESEVEPSVSVVFEVFEDERRALRISCHGLKPIGARRLRLLAGPSVK